MKKVSIPEPCHENWADFTPTEKGAFCGSCATDVIDFSNKTPFEVKSILADNAGAHMCGRFKKSQLEELNHDYVEWNGQSTTTFRSKFLYACLLVFGMTLFTGCSLQESSIVQQIFSNNTELNLTSLQVGNEPVDPDSLKTERQHLKGKVAYNPPVSEPIVCETPPDSVVKEEIFTKGDIAYDPEEFLLGDIASDPNELVFGDTIIAPPEEFEMLLGNIAHVDTTKEEPLVDTLYDDSMIDGLIKFEPLDDSIENEIIIPIHEDEMIQGGFKVEPMVNPTPMRKGRIKIEPKIIEVPQVTEIDTTKQTIAPQEIIAPIYIPEFHASVFPNPTSNQTTVEIQVGAKAHYNVYLYAIDGKKVKTLFNGLYQEGLQRISVDLSAYEAGSYLIVINGGKQKESFKLEKVE